LKSISKVREKPANADFTGQKSKRLCQCRYFVDAKILSKQGFVNAKILLTPKFCRHQDFVDAEVLLMPRFCQRRDFVGAEVLSTPIFC
jgi:hypothetical protein